MRIEIRELCRRWSLAVPAVALAASIGVQGVPRLHRTPPRTAQVLTDAIAFDVPGWAGRDVPLGANDFLSGEARSVLNFDEVVNREYDRDGAVFGVYVAYWGAGKMPTRMVAAHTPDRCWTENGWHCSAMQFQLAEAVDGQPLLPAQWRAFVPPEGGAPTYVLYWHLVDGRLYDYGRRFNQIPDPWRWFKDAVLQPLRGEREQYFVRLTSNRPFEELWGDPGIGGLMRDLGRLGLDATKGSRSL